VKNYTCRDRKHGVMISVCFSFSKSLGVIPACAVTIVRFSCRQFLRRLREMPSTLFPTKKTELKDIGCGRPKTAISYPRLGHSCAEDDGHFPWMI